MNFNIIIRRSDIKPFKFVQKTVDGDMLEIADRVFIGIHSSVSGKGYTATELASGLRLARGRTHKGAVVNAKRRIMRHGIERTYRVIQAAIDTCNGGVPLNSWVKELNKQQERA